MNHLLQPIRLEVKGKKTDDLTYLFGIENPNFGFKKKLSDDIEIENRTAPTFGVEPVSTITILITISTSIASSIAANYIYDWLKGRFSKSHLNDVPIRLKPEEIQKIIEQIRLQNNLSQVKDSNSDEKQGT